MSFGSSNTESLPSAVTESPGQTVGPWTLHETLGRGGNATVWKAVRHESEKPIALKLINTTKVEKEPYQRFVREIGFLREHQAVPGVLPLLDAHLPEQPTKADPPWLAMPVAVPISKALEGKSLADVVAAMTAIADTLSQLQRDSGIAHRDIKPGNLMVRSGQLLLIDVAFVQVRPSPWRQAVDLGNMMLVLAVRTNPQQVYRQALAYFTQTELAEAFPPPAGWRARPSCARS